MFPAGKRARVATRAEHVERLAATNGDPAAALRLAIADVLELERCVLRLAAHVSRGDVRAEPAAVIAAPEREP